MTLQVQGKNWLLGETDDPALEQAQYAPEAPEIPGLERADTDADDSEEPAPQTPEAAPKAAAEGPLEKFLARKQEAARALAGLIGDHRFLPMARPGGEESFPFFL